MSEWQPIETAPKDARIIVWDGFDVCIAKFIGRDWISFGCDGPAILSQSDSGTDYQEPGIVTHWMPLPEPPVHK